jgi:hypothetical protein
MKIFVVLFLLLPVLSFYRPRALKAPSLTKIWETDTLLIANESAIYDPGTDAVYISCMGNSDDTVDGDGFIAKLRLNGKIEKLHWITGLNCPKGLAMLNNKLLTIDINELVTIDPASAKILSKQTVTSGRYFNDIDVAPNGDVFLSESRTHDIVRYRNEKSEKYYSSEETAGLNGVHVQGTRLLFTGRKGNIYALSADLRTEIFADSCFNADGLEAYGSGFFCSSWQGKMYYFTPGGNTHKLFDVWPNKNYCGDIEVIESKNILLVPTLFNNKVIAYRIND